MNQDLEWLARNVAEWDNNFKYMSYNPEFTLQVGRYNRPYYGSQIQQYTKVQWHQARQDLGLIMTEEEEAMTPTPEQRNKYQREIKPGVHVDVYDVLQAWGVSNPALQHLIKKALQPGERGHKSKSEDMADIVASALRAEKLEGGE